MSLSGSELARITREGDDLVLAFAVAQVRPAAAPRFGQGDETAYLVGVTWRLTAASVDGPLTCTLIGRLSDSELWVDGEGRARAVLALPGTVPGPLTLHLRTSLGQALTLRAQRLEALLPEAGEAPRPSLAC